jgi:hypothetical protein
MNSSFLNKNKNKNKNGLKEEKKNNGNSTSKNKETEKIKKEIEENKKHALKFFEENLNYTIKKYENNKGSPLSNKNYLIFKQKLNNFKQNLKIEGKRKLKAFMGEEIVLTNEEKEYLKQKKMNEQKRKKEIIGKRILLVDLNIPNNKKKDVTKIKNLENINISRLLKTITNSEINNLKLNTGNIDEFLKKKAKIFIKNNPNNWKKELSQSTVEPVRRFGTLTNKKRNELSKRINFNPNTQNVYINNK